MSFMVVGHTKFRPDAHFELIKRQVNKKGCYSVDQLEQLINESSRTNECWNVKRLDEIRFYDWKSALGSVFGSDLSFPGIRKLRQFRVYRKDGAVLYQLRDRVDVSIIDCATSPISSSYSTELKLSNFEQERTPVSGNRARQLRDIAEEFVPPEHRSKFLESFD